MPFDRMLRQMIQQELQVVIAPLVSAVHQLQQNGNLAAQLTSLLGPVGIKRGPGRPRKFELLGRQPGTVTDLVLPRGRAGAKALAKAKK